MWLADAGFLMIFHIKSEDLPRVRYIHEVRVVFIYFLQPTLASVYRMFYNIDGWMRVLSILYPFLKTDVFYESSLAFPTAFKKCFSIREDADHCIHVNVSAKIKFSKMNINCIVRVRVLGCHQNPLPPFDKLYLKNERAIDGQSAVHSRGRGTCTLSPC